jgi:hypothetical protein
MNTIIQTSQALHEIETQVFKDLEVNPFRRDEYECVGMVIGLLMNEGSSGAIQAAALLTRLIAKI